MAMAATEALPAVGQDTFAIVMARLDDCTCDRQPDNTGMISAFVQTHFAVALPALMHGCLPMLACHTPADAATQQRKLKARCSSAVQFTCSTAAGCYPCCSIHSTPPQTPTAQHAHTDRPHAAPVSVSYLAVDARGEQGLSAAPTADTLWHLLNKLGQQSCRRRGGGCRQQRNLGQQRAASNLQRSTGLAEDVANVRSDAENVLLFCKWYGSSMPATMKAQHMLCAQGRSVAACNYRLELGMWKQHKATVRGPQGTHLGGDCGGKGRCRRRCSCQQALVETDGQH